MHHQTKRADVVFLLRTPAWEIQAYVVVSLDSTLTIVSGATIQNVTIYRSSVKQSTNWSGYEFYNTTTPLVNMANAEWQVPSVWQSPQQWCVNEICALSVWVGISFVYGE